MINISKVDERGNAIRPVRVVIPGYDKMTTAERLAGPLNIYPRFKRMAVYAAAIGTISHLRIERSDLDLLRSRASCNAPSIYAPRHRDGLDIPVVAKLLASANIDAHTITKAELFGVGIDEEPGLIRIAKQRASAWILGHCGGLPLDRAEPDVRAFLNETDHVLGPTGVGHLVIFPEGILQPDVDILNDIFDGACRVAKRSEAEILPIGIEGTQGGYSRLKRGHRANVAVAVGEPLAPGVSSDVLVAAMNEQQSRARALWDRAA